MKKLMVTLCFALMTAGMCSAQWYVGGAISYGSQRNDNGERRSSSFSFTPRVGYVLNEKELVGVRLTYQNSCSKYSDELTSNKGVIAPYYRYNVVSVGRFTFGIEAALGVGFGKMTGQQTRKEWSIGLEVSPVVSFGLTEHWWAEAYMDLFSLNYYNAKDGDAVHSSSFNAGFNADDVFSFSALHLGVVYRF